MTDISFRRVNNITGWMLALLSLVIYLLTIEPTVSFWDCGEFILSAWKLQVGHPPGAPLFLMLGRAFTLFSFGDQSKAALMVNILSAVASALTIMFLYWTIVHIVARVTGRDSKESSLAGMLPVVAAGVIGALAYAFSDTFWFSAVEGEVYATSSLFTAVVFWAVLKWENEADKAYSGRWIILIAYLMGLSVGVHLLNLLAIPAIVLVIYFRKYTPTLRGTIYALLVSAAILFLLVFVVLPYTVKAAGWFELLFVNVFGLPYNTGLVIYLVVVALFLVGGIRLSQRKGAVILNYGFTILTAVIIGYSSIGMIMIRAAARPPMNQNDPSDVFSMIYYVSREQYGSTPLVKGNYYGAPIIEVNEKRGGYIKQDGKYIPYNRTTYKYDSRFTTVFPRMYSNDASHRQEYEYWGNISGRKVSVRTASGTREQVIPTFSENLRFFFSYQLGYMYWRYFMWNFSGRQNDIQGNGNVLHGNWISGISAIDNGRLGDQELLPDSLRNNPGRNRYFMLPLLLGIAGITWHYRKNRNSLLVVATLFIMTGVAIVVYLNQYPLQPRERDYAYAASFYAFAIWIGMGFLLLYDFVAKYLRKGLALPLVFLAAFAAVPMILVTENWDDHNRSGRYTARDIGANYLNSCDDNAVLFTYGDNDSFPVWYAQDVEGIRTDVRVANLSYLNASWYIDMMRQKAYLSDPLPISLPSESYYPGVREQLPIVEQVTRPVPIGDLLRFVAIDEREAKIDFTGRGDYFNYIPVKRIVVPVDTLKLLESGGVPERYRERLTDRITWELPGREIYKNDLVIMDIIGTNGWERPIYYASTVPPDNYNGLDSWFMMEGLAYRIVPLDTAGAKKFDYGEINSEKMYTNLMERFRWGNASDPSVYLDENNRRMFNNFRRMFGVLARQLAFEGDTARAAEVLARCDEVVPPAKIPYDYYSLSLIDGALDAGNMEMARRIAGEMIEESSSYLEYIMQLDYPRRYGLDLVIAMSLESLRSLYITSVDYDLQDIGQQLEPLLDKYFAEFYQR